MLIVLEGLDGCGKTSVGEAVAKVLDGTLLHFPNDDGVTGPMIRSYLRGGWKTTGEEEVPENGPLAFQCLQLVNRMEAFYRLKDAGQSTREHLVLSRYWQSGLVYGELDGLDREWLKKIHEPLPHVDLNILLETSPVTAAKRREERDGGKDPERYEKRLSTYGKLANLFQKLWSEQGEFDQGAHWHVVDANESLVDVVSAVLKIVFAEQYHLLEDC